MFNRLALEKIQNGVCPYCGQNGFKFTIGHIVQKHKLSSEEVREEFGINSFEPLCTSEYSEICGSRLQCHSKVTLEVLRIYREHQPKTRRGFAPQSRENHLAWLDSDRRLEISLKAFATPRARGKLCEWAKEAWKKRERNSDGTFAGVMK